MEVREDSALHPEGASSASPSAARAQPAGGPGAHASLPSAWSHAAASADTRHGPMLYPVHDDPIGLSLRTYGEWAFNELDLLVQCVEPGGTVLDVGANVGTHTLVLARACGGDVRVVALEPQPFVFALLSSNVRENGLTNVEVVQACAGSAPGSASIPQPAPGSASNFGATAPNYEVRDPNSVPVIPLDSLSLGRTCLMKIDVEGSEADVLRGATTLIDSQRPIIYFEANSLDAAAAAVQLVRARGYSTFLHRAAAFNPLNFNRVTHNHFGYATETNVLALPSERLPALGALSARPDVFPFDSLDGFAALLLTSPRYGDPNPFMRDPVALNAMIAQRDTQLRSLQAALATPSPAPAVPSVDAPSALSDANEQLAQYEARVAELHRQIIRARTRKDEFERQLKARRREIVGFQARAEADAQRHRRLETGRRNAERKLAQHAEALERLGAELRRLQGLPSVRAGQALAAFGADVRAALREGVGRTARNIAKRRARIRRYARERRVIEASGLFDAGFYLDQCPDALDPLQHYLERGASRGLDPCPAFSTSYYVAQHPELARSPQNPFAHYLAVGRARGDAPKAPPDEQPPAVRAPAAPAKPSAPTRPELRGSGNPERPRATVTLPSAAEWAEARPHAAGSAVVDVILPAYRGVADTLRAVQRVLASRNSTPFELVVIDDCSPELELSRELRALAERGLFTYLYNADNLGFVRTVNRGMALHPDRDVLLLNSDTEVFHDWLDRLRAVASAPGVGTVTPLSNSATICSYPVVARDTDYALEVGFDELDRIAAEVNPGVSVEIPTAVGFCMYIRRDCLDATGLFDEVHFDKGYGEENDFCRHALARGYRSVLSCGVFVRHTGGASFQGEKAARSERAQAVLDALHPDYRPAVRQHRQDDPARGYRERIDLVRLQKQLGPRVYAIVTHDRGGGTEQHVQQLIALARSEGVRVLVLRPVKGRPKQLTASIDAALELPNLTRLSIDDPLGSARFLASLGIRHLHVHHLIDFHGSAPDWAEAIARSQLLTVDFTVHDYGSICPQINLIDQSGRYCGEPEDAACNHCIAVNGSRYGIVAIGPYRRRSGRMLAAMRRVFVPNVDVAKRLKRYYPDLTVSVVPHPETPARTAKAAELLPAAPLRVAVLGAIGPHKGFDVLLSCALDARERGLPLEFCVIGYTSDDPRAQAAGIEISGTYQTADEAVGLLEAASAHVCFFPAVWPETYAYTLSTAASAGLHPVAFDLGAIAQRLCAVQGGTLLPIDSMTNPAAINDVLLTLADPAKRRPVPPDARAYTLADYYGALV